MRTHLVSLTLGLAIWTGGCQAQETQRWVSVGEGPDYLIVVDQSSLAGDADEKQLNSAAIFTTPRAHPSGREVHYVAQELTASCVNRTILKRDESIFDDEGLLIERNELRVQPQPATEGTVFGSVLNYACASSGQDGQVVWSNLQEAINHHTKWLEAHGIVSTAQAIQLPNGQVQHGGSWAVTPRDLEGVESRIMMPTGAHEITAYARFYDGLILNGKPIIRGRFKMPTASRPAGAYFVDASRPTEISGCTVVTVYWNSQTSQMSGASCGVFE